ncbi:Xaa-Pro peptidase family protein [Maritimibacter sp. DP1N21-5]|uniref:M24 family metallopeptidase n=1 Tax=Maritimibacter sp. DP1N21-5 TaxID=2836867 RepID=UPI001C47463B|nr:Xaa-Pro peptidase family protein [Maritimibacter sp. DP1N21-5]MBV7410850.1 Xaa-Pro peptidase family protein [Maritimibacter sp. DP1N21-5]
MDRFAEYRAAARALGTDAVALVPGANFVRMMGQDFSTSERPTLIVVPVEGTPAAIMPNLELSSFAQLNFPGEVFDWRDQDGYDAAFAALAAHLPLSSLAVEGQTMRVFVHHALAKAYPGLAITDGERAISGLRLVKTADDIARMTRAIRISEAALGEVLADVRVGMTEREVEARLIAAQFAHGAEGMAFSPIVAANTNSALPHAHARDYALQTGDALLIDFGAQWGGFCADITRTVFVGHATDHQAAVYQTVYDAVEAGLAVTTAGVTAHEIDDAVQSVLEASSWPDRIRTKTGHGLGRQVHEEPYVMRGNHQKLPAGAVYTNEPGLYDTAEFGIRIEDDVLVTDTGYRLLTTFPKTLTVVG